MQPIQTVIPDHLYSAQKTLENGQTAYLGIEKVTEFTIGFWRKYHEDAYQWAIYLEDFCKALNQNITHSNRRALKQDIAYPNRYSETLEFEEAEYHKVTQFFLNKKYFGKKLFDGVSGGVLGMKQVLSLSENEKSVYMVYISTVQVQAVHHLDLSSISEEDSPIKIYNKLFGHLVMSYVFITRSDLPTVTHYGIFRNPSCFYDLEEKFKDISMILHGFGATFALTCLTGKKYMVTTPMVSMRDIFIKHLDKESLFMGTNDNVIDPLFLTRENREMLRKFPPIYYIDYKTEIHKIAFPGTFFCKSKLLSKEETEFTAPEGVSFNFAGYTHQALTTVVVLEKLASFY